MPRSSHNYVLVSTSRRQTFDSTGRYNPSLSAWDNIGTKFDAGIGRLLSAQYLAWRRELKFHESSQERYHLVWLPFKCGSILFERRRCRPSRTRTSNGEMALITIMHTFYNQHGMLPIHLHAWRQHEPGSARYVLIDDGSPTAIPDDFRMPGLHVYRVHDDIPWNIAGARNLGFHVATTEWVLSADVDYVVTADALAHILRLDFQDPNVVYMLSRHTNGGPLGCAPTNIIVNRQRFHEVGGYDEDYSGAYGKEEFFFIRCLRHHGVRIINCDHILLDCHPSTGRTRNLDRDSTRNEALFEKKMAELHSKQYQPGSRLRFSWSLSP